MHLREVKRSCFYVQTVRRIACRVSVELVPRWRARLLAWRRAADARRAARGAFGWSRALDDMCEVVTCAVRGLWSGHTGLLRPSRAVSEYSAIWSGRLQLSSVRGLNPLVMLCTERFN